MRLWEKGVALDQMILEFTVGEDPILDQRLVPHDVRASKAHARMLGTCGHLAPALVEDLCKALDQALADFEAGLWTITLEAEDCHTALENRLGALGASVHLGRSRNDQVLTAVRLYLKSAVAQIEAEVQRCIAALGTVKGGALPGYTHMQRAMPSTVADWAGAYATELGDSLESVQSSLVFLDKNPLGSAAGYGTPGLLLDRLQTALELGFSETHEPVTAPQLSRGKGESALAFGLCMVLQDLGRLAADLCLYNTSEFGFVRLPKEFTTGSSIMPQKRNPDVFELVRGHSAAALGDLQAIMALTTKLSSGYHRDLQLLKVPLFRLIDRALACLQVMTHAIPGIEFVAERCEAAMDPGLFAAERAFALVQSEGIPFREAYRRVAEELNG